MNNQQRELLTLILWLISPSVASQKPDIDRVLSIISQNEKRLIIKFNDLPYKVNLLRNNDGIAKELRVNRKNWKNSLYLDICGAPKISF